MYQTIGLYVLITVAIITFVVNCRNPVFLRLTLIYFALVTIALCLLEYGSSYSLNWDFARWHGGDTWQLFPLEISGADINPNTIPKASATYWFLTVLINSFYVTFPQAVVRGLGALQNNVWAVVTSVLFDLFGIGLGFVSVILTLSSLVSPYPKENWLVMLAGCIFIILIMGPAVVGDVKHGFKKYVPH